MLLNSEQKVAAESFEGPLLVLAGAGSGKTRVVTQRIVNLLDKGVPPSQILGLTFTNKAANEMKERVRSLTQNYVLICTFHSLGARILRESIHHLGFQTNFTIYDEDDTEKLMKTCIASLSGPPLKLDLKVLRGMISRTKNSLTSLEGNTLRHRSPEEMIFPSFYETYQSKLKEYNAVDYDDLLYLTLRLFQEHPHILEYYQNRWTYLLIDEYQDTNAVQYAMVNHLVAKHRNLCVVGDPDQSIYSWRGANIQNILNFENDYPGARVINLNQNYRSRSNILDAANALIKNNSNRYEKKLWSDRGPGEKIQHFRGDNEKHEAMFVAKQMTHHRVQHDIPLSEMVVFYRTNAQSRVFEDYLLQAGIPYVIVGGISFYQRREIKDILAWLRMVLSDTDFISFSRTINLPKRGLGETTLEKLRQSAELEGESILSYCEKLVSGYPLRESVKLSAKQKQGLQQYLNIIRELRQTSQTGLISALVTKAIDCTEYMSFLEEDRETLNDRKENLDALVAKAFEWESSTAEPNLSAFLEELSLKSTLDETNPEQEKVCLMTIHNGKGLEFMVTFLVGLEEDLFPHVNSRDDEEKLEEERRLCYVGMTRAKEYLYLTEVSTRFMWGVTRMQRPSRFLREIPGVYVEKIGRQVQTGYPKPFSSQRASMQKREEQPFINDMDQRIPEDIPKNPFACGEIVFHKEFGVGRIQALSEGTQGLTYQIFFTKDQSERSLVAKYAGLKRL